MWIPLGYFLARSWAVILGGRWELAFLVEETVGLFTTNLSKSTVLSVFNETNYILPNNWQLRLFFTSAPSCNHLFIHLNPEKRSCLCYTNRKLFKAGVHLNLIEILGSLKRDWKGKKKVMEHHQTVAWPHNGTPAWFQYFNTQLKYGFQVDPHLKRKFSRSFKL